MSKPEPQAAAKKKSAGDAVADLERRLAQLDVTEAPPVSTSTASVTSTLDDPPAFAAPPSVDEAVPVKGGKNALLARIMAAQERAKQAQSTVKAPPPPPPEDLLDLSDDVPAPPPSFQSYEQTAVAAPTRSPPAPSYNWDPHAPTPTTTSTTSAPPTWIPDTSAPSAPALEDLLALEPATHSTNVGTDDHNAYFLDMQPVAPPSQGHAAEPSVEEVLAALEGLTEEEKQALLAEQAKIMASIEHSQTSAAAAKADAFESRSFSTAVQSVNRRPQQQQQQQPTNAAHRSVTIDGQSVALHGQEQTRAAIQDGTAVLVQCLSCQNMMQVTKAAALMFCPVCQVVSPVEHLDGMDAAQAAQLQADMELAEQLQKEEYKEAAADRQERTSRPTSTPDKKKDQSWGEWLGLSATAGTTSSTSSPERPMSFAQKPTERGAIGVARPPGAVAETGTAQYGSRSYDDDVWASPGGGGARVAETKPLFNCVADSVYSAASTFTTAMHATTLSEDDEGNVHGVDSSSLLAMPGVSRESNYKQMDGN